MPVSMPIVPKKKLIGEILVDKGFITPQQLQAGLMVQEESSAYLGEILVEFGYLNERNLVAALAIQSNFPYIAINNYTLNESLTSMLPREWAVKNEVILLDLVGGVLSAVMTNPLNAALREELRNLTHCEIASFITTKTEIASALNRWYKTNPSVDVI